MVLQPELAQFVPHHGHSDSESGCSGTAACTALAVTAVNAACTAVALQ